ncbi:MAG: nucleotidyltransferase domain-containing protein [Rhodomicrobium sp.]
MTPADPVLVKFCHALDDLYGERVVLFGSRARGDAHPDSDYDIAIFLRDLANRDREVDRLAELQDRVMADTDPFIDAIPFPAGAWAERTTFMHALRREGRDL